MPPLAIRLAILSAVSITNLAIMLSNTVILLAICVYAIELHTVSDTEADRRRR